MPAVDDNYEIVSGETLVVGMATSPQMDVSLVASRTSGPAPLAVHFDATGTTDTSGNGYDTFREYGYWFDYDDAGSGNWTYFGTARGESKNTDIGGAIGAHVFRTPGTYAVRVRARDPLGNVEDAEVTITVEDPTTHYGSVVDISPGTSWPSWASDTMYRLEADGDYTSHGAISLSGQQDIMIIKDGSGADPIVTSFTMSAGFGNTTPTVRGVISEVSCSGLTAGNTSEYCLIDRCTSSGSSVLDLGPTAQTTFGGSDTQSTCLSVVECDLTGTGASYIVYGAGDRMIYMGNLARPTGQITDHVLRNWGFHKTVWQHNRHYFAAFQTTQHFKLNATGNNPYTRNEGFAVSQYGVFRQNVIGLSGNSINWSTSFSPQNSEEDERVYDVIAEENSWEGTSVSELQFGGARHTERGHSGISVDTNVFMGGPGGSPPYAVPEAFRGPYYTGLPAITTESPR